MTGPLVSMILHDPSHAVKENGWQLFIKHLCMVTVIRWNSRIYENFLNGSQGQFHLVWNPAVLACISSLRREFIIQLIERLKVLNQGSLKDHVVAL